MKILFATGSLSEESSGPYQTLLETARTLAAAGHEPRVVGTQGRREPRGVAAAWHPVPAAGFPRLGPASLHLSPRLGRWLARQERVDVADLQSVWIYNHATVARWCRERGVPYLVTVHGNFHPVARRISAWKKRLALAAWSGQVLAGARCLHALSDAEHRSIRDFGLRQPVAVVPNGVALPELPAGGRRAWRERAGGRRIALYLGRLHPIKGLDRLLPAWAELGEARRGWRLVLAGPDPEGYGASLVRLAGRLGLAGEVLFPGACYGEEKSSLLAAAGFFVLPSLSEGMPMAALEAMAHGVGVLVTEPCGLEEVERHAAGRRVPADAAGLRRGLRELVELSDEERQAMGRRARELVGRRFRWERVAAELVELYRWMTEEAEAPSSLRLD